MAAKTSPAKRRNKTVQLGDMIGTSLDPALKRRGFANRDLIAHWSAIAPVPWDKVAIPDKLVWPRRDRPDPEGAVLHLRCREGHGLALAHEGQAIAQAVNRYFGYFLVRAIRLSPIPLVPESPKGETGARHIPPETLAHIRAATGQIADEGLRAALEKLGHGVLGRAKA